MGFDQRPSAFEEERLACSAGLRNQVLLDGGPAPEGAPCTGAAREPTPSHPPARTVGAPAPEAGDDPQAPALTGGPADETTLTPARSDSRPFV